MSKSRRVRAFERQARAATVEVGSKGHAPAGHVPAGPSVIDLSRTAVPQLKPKLRSAQRLRAWLAARADKRPS